MEKLQLCIYFFPLFILGGETAGIIYFTVQSKRWSSYFSTYRMGEDARWGGIIFVIPFAVNPPPFFFSHNNTTEPLQSTRSAVF